MLFLNIDDISEEGYYLDQYASKEPWLKAAMAATFGARFHPTDEAHLTLILVRSGEQISMTGGGYLHVHATCDRCLKEYVAQQQVPIHILFVPHSSRSSPQDAKAANVPIEGEEEDLDCSYYEGKRIDVGNAVAEQIVLAQSMQSLCRSDCKGLCPTCGKDLNCGPCGCRQPVEASPLQALKGMKFPAKRPRRSSRTP